MYFRQMAVILDLPVTPTSESIHSSLIVLMDAENVDEAVGLPLLATVQDL
jgi:hypothetical protein